MLRAQSLLFSLLILGTAVGGTVVAAGCTDAPKPKKEKEKEKGNENNNDDGSGDDDSDEPPVAGEDESEPEIGAADAGIDVATSECNDQGCSAATVNTEKCTVEGGRSKLRCTQTAGCFKWTATMACSPDNACNAGVCSNCVNTCTLKSERCVAAGGRSREACTLAATGCTAWTAAQACSPSETCSNGTCN